MDATITTNGFHLLTDLAIILCVAAVTTVVFQRIRQPVILGYLLAGMIVGPHLPIPIFADEKVAHTLSELGTDESLEQARSMLSPPSGTEARQLPLPATTSPDQNREVAALGDPEGSAGLNLRR